MRNIAKKEILDTFIILLRLRLHKQRERARVKETGKLRATVRAANQRSQKRSIPFQLFVDGKNGGMTDKGERQDWHGVHRLKETHRCVHTALFTPHGLPSAVPGGCASGIETKVCRASRLRN